MIPTAALVGGTPLTGTNLLDIISAADVAHAVAVAQHR